MEVLITKESDILLANPVYLRITPLTVEDALARGVIDPGNPFSSNRASKFHVLLFFSLRLTKNETKYIIYSKNHSFKR